MLAVMHFILVLTTNEYTGSMFIMKIFNIFNQDQFLI